MADRPPAALILLGTGKAVGRHLAQAETVFEYRNSDASLPYRQRIEFRRGIFTSMDELWGLINLRNEVQQFREGLFKHDIATFDEHSVREAVLNAVIWVRQYPVCWRSKAPAGSPKASPPTISATGRTRAIGAPPRSSRAAASSSGPARQWI